MTRGGVLAALGLLAAVDIVSASCLSVSVVAAAVAAASEDPLAFSDIYGPRITATGICRYRFIYQTPRNGLLFLSSDVTTAQTSTEIITATDSTTGLHESSLSPSKYEEWIGPYLYVNDKADYAEAFPNVVGCYLDGESWPNLNGGLVPSRNQWKLENTAHWVGTSGQLSGPCFHRGTSDAFYSVIKRSFLSASFIPLHASQLSTTEFLVEYVTADSLHHGPYMKRVSLVDTEAAGVFFPALDFLNTSVGTTRRDCPDDVSAYVKYRVGVCKNDQQMVIVYADYLTFGLGRRCPLSVATVRCTPFSASVYATNSTPQAPVYTAASLGININNKNGMDPQQNWVLFLYAGSSFLLVLLGFISIFRK